MYDRLIYTGKVRWQSRHRAVLGALKVLWAAINGWIVSGIAEGDETDTADAQVAQE